MLQCEFAAQESTDLDILLFQIFRFNFYSFKPSWSLLQRIQKW